MSSLQQTPHQSAGTIPLHTPLLPPLPSLPASSTSIRASLLDALFEPCTQLHTLSLPLLSSTAFPSYPALIDGIRSQLQTLQTSSSTSDTEWLDKILAAHPRLGEKKVDSAQSRAEQAAMEAASGGEGGKEEEARALRALNEEYERTFPGLRYVVFVNGRSRAVVMDDMRKRIERGDLDAERKEAIEAMCDIAKDRAKKFEATAEMNTSA
ncbi:hypothetical protein M501DRAFT_1058374 [Patellaria atrata CBS 101060]|uniref:Oxo-4-hydroxy-4-carboxy-5-ureidoimidazoline decarboxylase domain-containing protein n=1 Tax=Patellaria atrata CBS 101060 TaxID=1346257 RepID=A0A9P4VM47_9PEZI|nr:hypothetical protein M501DRAFT_1058374 [Patellaria atrata CBS 101060]